MTRKARQGKNGSPRADAPSRGLRRRGQEPLTAAQQHGVYVTIAAHDMKNQIGVIRASAQLLERQARRAEATEPEAVLEHRSSSG